MAGFGPGANISGPIAPNFGGPVRNPRTGQWEFPKPVPVQDPWSMLCPERGRCGAPIPPPTMSRDPGVGDPGDVGIAVGRAAEAANIVRNGPPPAAVVAERCFSTGSSLRLDLATGNLMTQVRTPAGADFDPVPVLTYNAQSTTATELGYGWDANYRRNIDTSYVSVYPGDGSRNDYSTPFSTGYVTPSAGLVHSLY